MSGAVGTSSRLGTAALVLVLALGAAGAGCASREEKLASLRARAEAALEEGQEREALILLNRALKLDPSSVEINYRLARIHQSLGANARARFYYDEVYRLDPTHTDAVLAGIPYLYESDPETARARIQEVLEREPQNPAAHVRLAELELLREDTEAALQAALTAVELGRERALAHSTLATAYRARIRERQRAGKEPEDALFESAVAAYQRAFEAEGGNWQHLRGKALTYGSWPGHGEEAAAAWREAFQAAEESGNEPGMRSLAYGAFRHARTVRDGRLMRWALERQVELDPERVVLWDRLARLARAQGDSAEAVWRRALEQRPEAMGIHAAFARFLVREGRGKEALEHVRSLPGDLSSSPDALALLLELHLRNEDPEGAREALARLRSEHPGHVLTRLTQARMDLREGRVAEAAEALRSLAGIRERADVHRLLVRAEQLLGRPRAALDAVERVIELDPLPERSLFETRSELQAQLGDWQGVLETLREMADRGMRPDDGLLLRRAQALYETGRTQAGHAQLIRLQRESEDPLPAILMEARYEAERRPGRVRNLLERARESHPNHPEVLRQFAALDLARGRPEQALERLDAAAEGGLHPALRLLRARVLAALDRLEEAEAEARAAIEAAPQLGSGPGVLARILELRGSLEEAIATLEAARGEAGGGLDSFDLWFLGRLYLGQGNLERARAVLEATLERNPDLHVAANDLAFVLAEQEEQLDRALALASAARAARPNAPAIADTLGWVYYRRGLPGPALEQFRAAIELAGPEPAPADFHYHLGLALRELGRDAEAEAAFDAALSVEPEHGGAREAKAALAAAADSRS